MEYPLVPASYYLIFAEHLQMPMPAQPSSPYSPGYGQVQLSNRRPGEQMVLNKRAWRCRRLHEASAARTICG